MFGVVGVALLQTNKDGRLALHHQLFTNFKKFLQQPEYIAITLFFWLVLLSGVLTEDYDYWWERLRLKAPFLVLPFIFYQLPKLSKRQYHHIFYFLVLSLVITCCGIGINYGLHFDEINQAIKEGRSIPTPRNHIRFSLILALGIISGGYLYFKRYFYKYQWERQLLLGSIIFLFLFIHVLSVRSGLLALYATLFVLLIRFILIEKKYILGISGILLLTALPFIAYHTVPSFQKKISYALWDLKMYKEGKGDTYSDSGRLISLQIGLKIGNAYPIMGVGAGNLRQVVKEIYKKDYPNLKEPKMPHNQWVSVYAGTGIIGLLIFGWAFFLPLLYRNNYHHPLFLGFYAIIFTSLMMENTLENSIGIGFFCFFLLLLLNYKNAET